MTTGLRSQRVLVDGQLTPATVRFEDGVITAITPHDDASIGVLDVGDQVVMPGLVDTHVHINEPGRTQWEGFATATKAAAAGGVTTVVDMPLNCIPATTTAAALSEKLLHAAPNAWVDLAYWGGIIPGSEKHLRELAAAGIVGAKCFLIDSGVEEFPAVTLDQLRPNAQIMAELKIPLLAHAELDLGAPEGGDPRKYATFLASRPPAWEVAAINALIALSRDTGVAVHIVHLSAAEALPIIAAAKSEGLPITAETCPHYLTLTAESVPDGETSFKCCPPIRGEANQEALWAGLADGTIDMITSDHSPCTPHLKLLERGDFMAAWGGISSLQLGLGGIYTAAIQRGHSIAQISNWMSLQPAKLAGLADRKGHLSVGADADFVVWSPEKVYQVTPEMLKQRHTITPYNGTSLFGVVHQTWLRGTVVFKNGSIEGIPSGRAILGRSS
jgi:allantoinase